MGYNPLQIVPAVLLSELVTGLIFFLAKLVFYGKICLFLRRF